MMPNYVTTARTNASLISYLIGGLKESTTMVESRGGRGEVLTLIYTPYIYTEVAWVCTNTHTFASFLFFKYLYYFLVFLKKYTLPKFYRSPFVLFPNMQAQTLVGNFVVITCVLCCYN